MNDDGHDHAGHDHDHTGHSHDLSADADRRYLTIAFVLSGQANSAVSLVLGVLVSYQAI